MAQTFTFTFDNTIYNPVTGSGTALYYGASKAGVNPNTAPVLVWIYGSRFQDSPSGTNVLCGASLVGPSSSCMMVSQLTNAGVNVYSIGYPGVMQSTLYDAYSIRAGTTSPVKINSTACRWSSIPAKYFPITIQFTDGQSQAVNMSFAGGPPYTMTPASGHWEINESGSSNSVSFSAPMFAFPAAHAAVKSFLAYAGANRISNGGALPGDWDHVQIGGFSAGSFLALVTANMPKNAFIDDSVYAPLVATGPCQYCHDPHSLDWTITNLPELISPVADLIKDNATCTDCPVLQLQQEVGGNLPVKYASSGGPCSNSCTPASGPAGCGSDQMAHACWSAAVISPINWLSASSPPWAAVHGTGDVMITTANFNLLASTCATVGCPAYHAFSNSLTHDGDFWVNPTGGTIPCNQWICPANTTQTGAAACAHGSNDNIVCGTEGTDLRTLFPYVVTGN